MGNAGEHGELLHSYEHSFVSMTLILPSTENDGEERWEIKTELRTKKYKNNNNVLLHDLDYIAKLNSNHKTTLYRYFLHFRDFFSILNIFFKAFPTSTIFFHMEKMFLRI